MELLFFLFQVVLISLSGVMAPGPLSAAALAMGTQSPYAGVGLAIGHGIIEFPLMFLIMLGLDKLFKSTRTKIIIGLVGGTFLLLMAIQMLSGLSATENQQAEVTKSTPVLAGIILSAGNPYFLLWWATVGSKLITDATGFGIWAFGIFAIVHWLCDFVWFCVLSWASFRGTALLGPRSQSVVLLICSVVLFIFGLFFIYKAIKTLVKRL